jgi:hypothetical protein
MKHRSVVCAFLLFCFVGLLPIPGLAIGTRGSSNNGVDNGAPFWNLFGPTAPLPRAGGTVLLRTQVVCANQQVASAVDVGTTDFADAGSCKDGAYLFLYQITSTASNLTVVLKNLVGFTPVLNDPDSSYGVETCDSAMNTLELCSNVAGATTTALKQLAKITATVSANNTKVTFTIPKVPVFPTGSASQGSGLTLVVVTQQAPGLPVNYPKLSFK